MRIETHDRENNSESEGYLNENKPRLARQCERVLDLLKNGKRLTVRSAMLEHGVSSLPRRILDLKESGVKINHTWIMEDGARKYKEWFIEEETVIHNFARNLIAIGQGELF